MKKISKMLIVFSLFFISNKTFAALVCVGCSYSCGGNTYYNYNYNDYQQCAERERTEKVRLETEVKQKIYNERIEILSQYKDLFLKVGVNLTLDTSIEEYEQWLSKLKIEKADYIQKQEDKQKMEELENRIKELEAQKNEVKEEVVPIVEIVIPVDTKEVVKPVIENKLVQKPIIKKEELKKEIIEKVSPEIEKAVPAQVPVNNEQKPNAFKKIINWFKSLI